MPLGNSDRPLFFAVVLSRLPALSSEIGTYPSDTARWAAPAVNYANYGVEHSYLPLVDQGDYGYMTAQYYYRWPLPPFYLYGLWASVTSDQTLVLRLVPLALSLITTLYCFLIASLLFKEIRWAFLSTVLFAFIPGHFFLSVQISDTQFWIVALVGGIFHRLRYEQTGDSKHMVAHLGLITLGCFSSWFGYLGVAAHFFLGMWSDVYSRDGKSRLAALTGLLNRYRLVLLGIVVISLALQLGVLYWLTGNRGFNSMSRRFSFWVTGLTNQNQEIGMAQRVVSLWPRLFYVIVSTHIPRLFGWPLVVVCLATRVLVVFQFDRIKKMVHWDRLIRLLVIHSFVLMGYLIIFTRHASQNTHTFTYQQISPIVAICTVLAIAVVTGFKFSGRLQLAATLACCMFLVTPKFVEYYLAPSLALPTRGNHSLVISWRLLDQIDPARTFGETVKENSLISDFVLTNVSDPRSVAGRVVSYTARRTLAYEKNEWAEISPYLENESIMGLIFLHQYDAPMEYRLDEMTLGELTSRANLVGETNELLIYRLK